MMVELGGFDHQHHHRIAVRVFPEPRVNDSVRPSRAQRDYVAWTPVRYGCLERRRVGRRSILPFECEGEASHSGYRLLH
jgi:hypothetical protein